MAASVSLNSCTAVKGVLILFLSLYKTSEYPDDILYVNSFSPHPLSSIINLSPVRTAVFRSCTLTVASYFISLWFSFVAFWHWLSGSQEQSHKVLADQAVQVQDNMVSVAGLERSLLRGRGQAKDLLREAHRTPGYSNFLSQWAHRRRLNCELSKSMSGHS